MRDIEYHFENYRLVAAKRELWRGIDLISTPRLVFDCLLHLIRHRDRAVGRDELVAAIWGRVDVSDGQVNQLMLRVRRAFGDDVRMQNSIRTVPGFGYRWVVDVDEAGSGEAPPPRADAFAPPDSASSEIAEPMVTASAAPGDVISGTSPPERAVSRHMVILLAFVIMLLAVLGYLLQGRDVRTIPTFTSGAEQVAAVLPMQVSAPSDASWVRLAAMDLIAERMRSTGLQVVPSESVLLASHGAGDLAQPEEHDKLRRALGAGLIVVGKASRSSSSWKVELSTTSADQTSHRVQSEHVDVIEALRQSADLLLAALGQTPTDAWETTTFEERSRQIDAALLANELDAARAIMNAIAPPERDAVSIRYRSALIDLRAGQFDAAEATLNALSAAPSVHADASMNARVFSARGSVHGRRGKYAAAEHDFDAAVRSLEKSSSATDLGRALNGRGVSRIGLQKFDAAALDIGQARVEYAKAADPLGLAQADTNLGLLEAERGRLEQALPYLTSAADRFEILGAVERKLSVLIPVFDAQTLLLRWQDALQTSEQQWALRHRMGDPGLGIQIEANRGMALLALGRNREAEALLVDMRQHFVTDRPDVMRHLHSFEAALAMQSGQEVAAATAAAAALDAWPDNPGDVQRAGMELLRQRALIATDMATEASIGWSAPPVTNDSDAAVAPARLVASAEWAAYQQHDREAERMFRRARELAEVKGVPGEVALVAAAYARWLLAHGRPDKAGALAGRVAPWADRDFDCALLQVAVLHAQGQRKAWSDALHQAQSLAGERVIPAALSIPPVA